MANIWFCSDLHFGHKKIGTFRSFMGLHSEEENREKICSDWKKVVTKEDIVYVLGDAAFTMESVETFSNLPGLKYLIRGNHDGLNTSVYLKHFKEVYGIVKYKDYWLSHAPLHPDELRGRVNLHGHVHNSTIRLPFNPVTDICQLTDRRYLNCCPENLVPTFECSLVSLDQVRKYMKE